MIQAIDNKIVVEYDDNSYKTQSGLVLEAGQNRLKSSIRGTVISIGSNVKDIKPGDKVIFKFLGSGEYEEQGKKYGIVSLDNVMCKIIY